jgi:ATP-binding cassette subfamily B (MDR/TAP) protein 1
VSVVALGLGFYFTWELTLVILATLPILAVILFFVSKHLAPAIEAQKRDLSLASKYTNAAISNINTVKAYNGKDHETWQYYTTIKRTAASYFLQARANALQFGFIKCATVGLFVQGFWFGLVLVNRGVDPARVYTTYYACLIAMQSIEIVLPQWLVLAKGKSAGHTLKAMMQGLQRNRGRKINMMRGSVVPDTCHGDIEIKNVKLYNAVLASSEQS